MEKNATLAALEKTIGCTFPALYKKFLCEVVQDRDGVTINNRRNDTVCIYHACHLAERNQTYTVQDAEPGYFLIGQDGDIGYFIRMNGDSDKIYSLDLGALGSLPMDEEASDIYSLSG
ncbi:SMI1/KNR4 family protein [Affinibrenneria salicis]|uniref:SMI1/KNR4 family protein n=1 Tax=Affinibrenneria salicis TaxID=2590031 RepID=A0A5J5G4P0_9GAMM|nr:SMI1/KNR4 family protein [Affinibrenneria salicis]KAA9002009.1 SMI1/KNR4 family protein [Affinibrenneria salicis]